MTSKEMMERVTVSLYSPNDSIEAFYLLRDEKTGAVAACATADDDTFFYEDWDAMEAEMPGAVYSGLPLGDFLTCNCGPGYTREELNCAPSKFAEILTDEFGWDATEWLCELPNI